MDNEVGSIQLIESVNNYDDNLICRFNPDDIDMLLNSNVNNVHNFSDNTSLTFDVDAYFTL
jgi:hypothetical protein